MERANGTSLAIYLAKHRRPLARGVRDELAVELLAVELLAVELLTIHSLIH
jgi:hypothetical protein